MQGVINVRLETRRLSDIHPYHNNPRNNDPGVDAVAESIAQCGYCAPIIVDEDGEILAGHTRLKALQKLGWDLVEVVVKDGLSEDQKKKYRLLDNKTSEFSSWDIEALNIELEDIDFSGFDFNFTQPDIPSFDEVPQSESTSQSSEDRTTQCPKCGFEWVE